MLFRLCLLLLHLRLALCKGRWVLDQKNCNTLGKYNEVKEVITTGLKWAKLASENINKPPLLEKAHWLFGTEASDIQKAQRDLHRIGSLVFDKRDPLSPEWLKDRDEEDAVIFCGTRHIEDLGGGKFHDPAIADFAPGALVRDVAKYERDPDNNKNSPVAGFLGVAYNPLDKVLLAGHKHPPATVMITEVSIKEMLTLHQWSIQELARAGRSLFDLDLVPSHLNLSPATSQARGAAVINYAVPVTRTVLHELSHTRVGGEYLDVPEGQSYSWYNTVRHHDPNNAEAIAFISLIAHVVLELDMDVTRQGDLVLPGAKGAGKAQKGAPKGGSLTDYFFGHR